MHRKICKEKVQMNLMLDPEIAEWIKSEAEDSNMTFDEVVESMAVTIQCLWEGRDQLFGELASLNMDYTASEMVN